jgi:hypothetical protein
VTFEAFHRLTWWLSGHYRLWLFERLPRRAQNAMWRDLSRRENTWEARQRGPP